MSHINDITVRVVPNEEIKQRKGFTGADWWWDEHGSLQVRVATEIYYVSWQQALILHEITEALLCRDMGITQKEVDDYDQKYQKEHAIDLNAGDEADCPYNKPHTYATAVERIYAGVVGINWKPYDDFLSKI